MCQMNWYGDTTVGCGVLEDHLNQDSLPQTLCAEIPVYVFFAALCALCELAGSLPTLEPKLRPLDW